MAFESSQGTTFTFDGYSYKCMDISHEKSAPSRERVDMSTLDLAEGAEMVMVVSPLKPKRDPYKFTITFRSEGTIPAEGVEATLTTADGSGTYRCTKASVSRKTNAYVEGQADFEEIISGEDLTA
jgi:hypothetical protein